MFYGWRGEEKEQEIYHFRKEGEEEKGGERARDEKFAFPWI